MAMIPYDDANPATNASRASAIIRNNLDALFNGDTSPLRPRAQASPNMTVAVAGTDVESYWRQVWVGLLLPLNYAGGNSPALSAPSANPRISLLTIDSAGTLAWTHGAEAGSPVPPNCPEDKTAICWVYCKTTMVKIVNFEDTGSNPNEGYIYRDVRPFLNLGGAGTTSSNFQCLEKDRFGDGSDGDVTISSNTTLAAGTGGVKIMRYNNLTVNTGFYLEGNAVDKVLVILVKTKLTLNGTIRMNGRGGVGGAVVAHNTHGKGGKAGAFGGGAGGSYTTYMGGGGGGDGQDGQDGDGSPAGGGGGDNLPLNLGGHSRGLGGTKETNFTGGAGLNFFNALKNPLPFEIARYLFGGGGGSGISENYAYPPEGPGGTGGGGIWIEANEIEWGGAGLVSCNGTAGADCGAAASGGGGGGGGGFAQVVYKTKSGSSTIQATPGAGGISGGGRNGGAGAPGLTGEFEVK